MIKQILDTIVSSNKLPTKVTATTNRREALTGARYIISCVRVGGLEAYADDIRIPLKYGVDQCVGDTICAGGILYGQRNIPSFSTSARTSANSPSPARSS
jgi:alpha-galactosidase